MNGKPVIHAGGHKFVGDHKKDYGRNEGKGDKPQNQFGTYSGTKHFTLSLQEQLGKIPDDQEY